MLNTYNPYLISCWKANMDIKYVDSIMSGMEYYVNKQENSS